MNGKQAKRLRRAALGLAVTLEQNGKKIDREGYRTIVHERASAQSIMGLSSASNPEPVVMDPPKRTQVVRRDTLKGIYKNLKSGLK